MVRHVALLAILVLSPLALADTPVPKSPTAVKAIDKADAAVKAAHDAYTAACLKARRAELAELQTAQKQAMARSDLDEVTAVTAKIKDVQEEIAEYEGIVFTVEARKDWQASPVTVRAGQAITLRARGRWCANTSMRAARTCGPEGMVDPKEHTETYYLECRIGEGEARRVNTELNFVADADGPLQFEQHDADHSDNDGGVTVAIVVTQ